MRLRVLFSLGAALPISPSDGEAVFNYRASVDAAHFLGKLLQTLNQVIHGEQDSPKKSKSQHQDTDSVAPSSRVKTRTRTVRRQSKMSKGSTPKKNESFLSSRTHKPIQRVTCPRPNNLSLKINPSPETTDLAQYPRWATAARTMIEMAVVFLKNVPKSLVRAERSLSESPNSSVVFNLSMLLSSFEAQQVLEEQASSMPRLVRWTCSTAAKLLSISQSNRLSANKTPKQ